MDNQNPFANPAAGAAPPLPQQPAAQPAQPASPAFNPSTAPVGSAYNPVFPQPPAATTPAVAAPPSDKEKRKKLFMLIGLIVASVFAVVFIILFVWMYVQWDDVKTDVEGQINEAVALAVNETKTTLETEFAEKEKYPYKTFSGPVDYGSLTFEYPKTWNVYIEQDAATGGDFVAYFRPDQVTAIRGDNVYSLRVSIVDRLTDSVNTEYQGYVQGGLMTAEVRTVNGANANIYSGQLPGGKLRGYVAVFKIRDKTAIIRTDAELYKDDYFRILDTVRYNV